MAKKKELVEKHGVIFAIWDGKNIQLEKRTNPNKLFFGYTIIPGGAVEAGETLEEALFREVKEEYGVKVLKYNKIGFVPNTEGDGILNVRHVYIVTKWDGVLSNPEAKNEHVSATLTEAEVQCEHPLSKFFIKMIRNAVQAN